MKNSDTKKVLKKTFWRTFTMGASWEFTKQMASGFAYAMVPSIDAIYGDKKEKSEALQRHMEFFNITNVFAPLVLGISIAMEQKNSEDESFDTSLINNIKVSLMGPLSAIGDSLIMSTWRIIVTGIAITFAVQGNVMGPILFFLLYNVPCTILRYYGLYFGYNKGVAFFEKADKSHIVNDISEKASILGMIVIGAMTSSLVYINSPVTFGMGDSAVGLIDLVNQIVPNLIPLLVTLGVYGLLQKKFKIGHILVIIIGVSILGSYFNILIP
ncbi:PTS system mannose/fructose/sorbose family transporter subunit IID [Erysipelothrix urinaevulpis]|uniref:PTS system mannose/fructose/sorbose family transporter subunit IID n=1 Tax=Erysipelothrix urinaevulpis TaxID=2683717 RepID=UPI00135BD749|nr:PTS system mannose/fructose/sorbose family transporter subunit IID [Erysipelothrix urinaevulpis]